MTLHPASPLPQMGGRLFVTDGGIETTLIFQEGLDLPYFAAFPLAENEAGRQKLRDYYLRYVDIAHAHRAGLVLESATWRASPDWGERLGYTKEALRLANTRNIELLQEIRREHETPDTPMVISGCLGPRGDGYDPGALMTTEEACRYHAPQTLWLAEAGADLVSAITMTNVAEATGIAEAAREVGLPVVLSFTVETDGRLPTGEGLGEAIGRVDAATGGHVSYYMVNCAHPEHFKDRLGEGNGNGWTGRIRGVRANASRASHAELNEAQELDDGDPNDLGRQYVDLKKLLPNLNVLGGCCGTDHRHVGEIAEACAGFF